MIQVEVIWDVMLCSVTMLRSVTTPLYIEMGKGGERNHILQNSIIYYSVYQYKKKFKTNSCMTCNINVTSYSTN
jgi:hypothetical protein